MPTGNSENTLQARVRTAPEEASEGGGEDVDIEGAGRCIGWVLFHGHPTDHHRCLTSKLTGSRLRGGRQYPHFTGRETEAHRG